MEPTCHISLLSLFPLSHFSLSLSRVRYRGGAPRVGGCERPRDEGRGGGTRWSLRESSQRRPRPSCTQTAVSVLGFPSQREMRERERGLRGRELSVSIGTSLSSPPLPPLHRSKLPPPSQPTDAAPSYLRRPHHRCHPRLPVRRSELPLLSPPAGTTRAASLVPARCHCPQLPLRQSELPLPYSLFAAALSCHPQLRLQRLLDHRER